LNIQLDAALIADIKTIIPMDKQLAAPTMPLAQPAAAPAGK